MLLRIVRKEVLEHLLSLRFAIACVLCFIVILSSLFVRCRDYAQRLDDYHENRVIEANARKNMDHPWRVTSEGVHIHQAPLPLNIFVRGVEGTGDLSVRVNSHDEPQLVASSPPALLFPAMDMVSFVGVIMSLLAIVFGYDAISGEKERGTLRLMLSYNVPRDTVLMGKWIGGYVALVVPFVMAVISGAAIVLVQPGISLTGSEWMKFAGVAAVSLLYIAAIYSAAVYVSCVTWRSSTSVMVLVTAWMVVVLAIPNLSPYLAQAWLPTRSAAEVHATKKDSREEIRKREIEAKMELYDKEHFGTHENWREGLSWRNPEDRKKMLGRRRYRMDCRLAADLQQMREVQRINQDFGHRLEAQVALGKWISRASPFSCFAMAATEMTDTGVLGKRRFLELIRKHQEELTRFGYAEWMAMLDHRIETGERIQWDDPANRKQPFPVFKYEPPATGDYVKAVGLDIIILAAATVLFFMLSYVSFLRYDVR